MSFLKFDFRFYVKFINMLSTLSPFTNIYGLARSLIAISGLITLTVHDTEDLFIKSTIEDNANICNISFSLYCIISDISWARLISLLILLLVISGFLPQVTSILHWWVAYSFHSSVTIGEGGDQVAAIVTLLIIPLALTDRRLNHWSTPKGSSRTASAPYRNMTGNISLLAIKLQTAVIYFVAGISKFAEEEWSNGSAMHYWLVHPMFGVPSWLHPAVFWLTANPILVTLMTWSVPFVEIFVAFALLIRADGKRQIFWILVMFHLGIALIMGIWSFSLIMIAVDILYLFSTDKSIRFPKIDQFLSLDLTSHRTS